MMKFNYLCTYQFLNPQSKTTVRKSNKWRADLFTIPPFSAALSHSPLEILTNQLGGEGIEMEPFAASHTSSRVGNMALALRTYPITSTLNPSPPSHHSFYRWPSLTSLLKAKFIAVDHRYCRYFTPSGPSLTKSHVIHDHIWMASAELCWFWENRWYFLCDEFCSSFVTILCKKKMC